MRCPECGQENRDVARFCQNCGAILAPGTSPDVPLEPTHVTEHESPSEWTEGPVAKIPAFPEIGAPEPSTGKPDPWAEEQDPHRGLPYLQPEWDAGETEALETVSGGTGAAANQLPAQPGQDDVDVQPEVVPPEPAGLEPIPAPKTEDEQMVSEEVADDLVIEPWPSPIADGLSSDTETPSDGEPPQNETPFHPLDLGAVVHGRYQVIEVLAADERQARYRVRDLQRCSRCGFTDNSPDEAFCASCGALMEQKPVAIMQERVTPEDAVITEGEGEEYFQDQGRHYWVWQEQEQKSVREEQSLMRLTIGHKSDTGQVRELDEDSLFVLAVSSTYEAVTHQLGLFVVADGMGGHAGGEVASRMAIQNLVEALFSDVLAPELTGNSLSTEDIPKHMERAVQIANDRVYLERQKRETDMGTTLTIALVIDWMLYLAHVGDCRGFVWGQDGLQQLTTDHSVVAGMVAAGTIRPEDIYSHPQRSVIYRSIGDRPAVEVDLSTVPLNPDDRLVLCSDGLWEMIHNEGIADVLLRESDPQQACDIMVEQANLAGGSDNISIVIVQL